MRPEFLNNPRGITIGSTTTEAIAAYPELEFGINGLSGDVMGWTGDFELILFADFGPNVDMGTDLSLLEGHITGIRLPLNLCPDELMF